MRRNWVLVCVMVMGCGADGGRGPVVEDASPDTAVVPDARPPAAALSALATSAGVLDPPFVPSVTEYDLDLVLDESMVAFTATVDDATARLTIDAAAVSSGVVGAMRVFDAGSRVVEIVVAGTRGSTTYRVHVHRGVDALSQLALDSGTLVPGFAPAVTAYAIGLPQAIRSVVFTPVALIPERAAITLGGAPVASGAASTQPLSLGSNAELVTVTPRTRPRTARTYAIDAGRGTDALASIRLSYADGAVTNPLSPVFDPATATYTVSVGMWLRAVQITVTPLVAGGTIEIDGSPARVGAASAPIALPIGTRSIAVSVTAPGGQAKTYTVAITRASRVRERAEQLASNAEAGDLFGERLALEGDTLVVASSWESSAATGIDGDQHNNDAPRSGAVYVFVRVAGVWVQQAYLKASNAEHYDFFGSSLAISGDTIAVGASGECSSARGVGKNQLDNSMPAAGAVYVFRRAGGTWAQEAYIKASNPAELAIFSQVALHGDVLVVGAPRESSAATGVGGDQTSHGAPSSGAAYIFRRHEGVWAQEAYVKASNTGTGDKFGDAVAVWGDTVVVGAPDESSGVDPATDDVPDSGAVYVFTRSAGTWSQQALLKAEFPEVDATFGASLAIWRDTLAVGAPHAIGPHLGPGAVHVFERTGTHWGEPRIRTALAPDVPDYFGLRVSLWGDTLVVGAAADDSGAAGIDGDPTLPGPVLSGAAQVFTRARGLWLPETYIKASVPAEHANFCAVAVSGDTIVIGAPGTGGAGHSTGSFYVFQ